jgi:hypothetical protein
MKTNPVTEPPTMSISDGAGRTWMVVGVTDLGIVGLFWGRALRFLVRQGVRTLDQELRIGAPVRRVVGGSAVRADFQGMRWR